MLLLVYNICIRCSLHQISVGSEWNFMALVQCGNCRKNISDKAERCPHCGVDLRNTAEIKSICQECHAELLKEETVCHNCGCPVDVKDNPDIKKRRKSFLIIGIIVLIFVVLGLIYLVVAANEVQKSIKDTDSVQKQNEIVVTEETTKKKESNKTTVDAETERKQKIKEYRAKVEDVTYTMLSGAADAEEAGCLIQLVWFNAIWKEHDDETDRFTCPDGEFVEDFNIALENLYADDEFVELLANIMDNQDEVANEMKKLKNPPEECEDMYKALKEYYSSYSEITGLALCPEGSFETFSSSFSEADSKTVDCYDEMMLYIKGVL